MSLVLTGTRDQALLAMVLEEARKVAEGEGTYVDRGALQKILYFLSARGVPMGYRFDLYHSGPFCDEVLRDAEWLQADGVLRDASANPEKYANYVPGSAIGEIQEVYREHLEPHRKDVREIVRALAPLKPEHMEAVATLHYLYRWFAASAARPPFKERVVARFAELKGDRFPAAEVASTYDRMAAAGLIGD